MVENIEGYKENLKILKYWCDLFSITIKSKYLQIDI